MKIKTILYTIIIFISSQLLNNQIIFSPLPYAMAINPQTKECGYYWGGDDNILYKLSGEWKIYYPEDESVNGIFASEYGDCTWGGTNPYESCCKELGFTYINGNIGALRGTSEVPEYKLTMISDETPSGLANYSICKIISIIIPWVIIIVILLFIVSLIKAKVDRRNKSK